jgi:hypothetical protein
LAVIRENKLFTQPDCTHLGECSICCLPLPVDIKKSTINGCCYQLICNGCCYTNILREIEQGLESKCAFCRETVIKTEETENDITKRVKANDTKWESGAAM